MSYDKLKNKHKKLLSKLDLNSEQIKQIAKLFHGLGISSAIGIILKVIGTSSMHYTSLGLLIILGIMSEIYAIIVLGYLRPEDK